MATPQKAVKFNPNSTGGGFSGALNNQAQTLLAAATESAQRSAIRGDTVTPGASEIDWAASDVFAKTLSANTTFTFANAADGQTIIVGVTNTASNYTVAWPSVIWSGGSSPTQTVGARTDVYTFVKIGSVIYGAQSANHYTA